MNVLEKTTDLTARYDDAPAAMPTDFDRLLQGNVNQFIFNDARMDRMMRMAEIMAKGKVTVPTHLQNNIGDCMAIVLQAAQWNMDPFAVAQKTHLVSGKLGYEAQLVNAVVITRAPITGRPQYEWFGDWSRVIGKFKEKFPQKGDTPYRVPGWTLEDESGLGVRISVTMKGESEPRVLDLLLEQATVRNSTLWAGDPKQQLAYLAIKRWARLHCPDVLLGVYSADELEAPEPLYPPEPPLAQPPASRAAELKARLNQSSNEAQSPLSHPIEVDPETGEILPPPDPIADLIKEIVESPTIEFMEKNYRDAVAALKNGEKKRAVAAWNERKTELQETAASAVSE